MERLTVGLDERAYEIIIGTGCLDRLGSYLKGLDLGRRAAVVVNGTVAPLYYGVVGSSLAAAGFEPHLIEIPDGEHYKNSDTLNGIYTSLIEKSLNRGAFIVALGGGVTGDMAGFAAATYLRGIPFVQVPTTLLAQVDSSVGGKTGINHYLGKNLVGAFYQPRLVLVDVATLRTLPEREYLAGLAEVVKYGVVLDRELFEDLAVNVDKLLEREPGVLERIILRSCSIKASVVEQDERESGLRAVLNYGHTLGHAVEALAGYGTFLHGEAVAIGMVCAARISESFGISDAAATADVITLLERLGLPTKLPSYGRDEYLDLLLRDKKVRDSGLTFVLNRGIGAFELRTVTDIGHLLNVCGLEDQE